MHTLFIFVLYQLIQILLFPFLIIFILLRKLKRKPIFGSFSERFGVVPKSPKNKKIIWVHAVSVGEVLSVQSTIAKIKKEIPNVFCYLTVGTLTGKEIAKKKQIADIVSFIPYDFLPTMLISFKRIKPNEIIIVEAETWPNLLILAKFKKIPTYIINARISKRSKPKYQKLKFIFKTLFNLCEKIYTQSKKDTVEFEKLGVTKERLITLGNIKTPNVIEKHLLQEKHKNKMLFKNINFKHPTLLIGSIHPGELDIYINLFKKLKEQLKDLKLILAPRHFHWKKELLEKLSKSNISSVSWEDNSENITIIEKLKNLDALVILKLGELFNLYPLCNIFFLGGTFVPVGGHNLVEPAVWNKVSIIGPYYFNCKVIADDLEKNNGLIKVKNENELFIQTKNLLENKKYIDMGKNARQWLESEVKEINKKLDKFVASLR